MRSTKSPKRVKERTRYRGSELRARVCPPLVRFSPPLHSWQRYPSPVFLGMAQLVGSLRSLQPALVLATKPINTVDKSECVPRPGHKCSPHRRRYPQIAIAFALDRQPSLAGSFPGVAHRRRRPAADETLIDCSGAVGTKVGIVLVQSSPSWSWTRVSWSTSACRHGPSLASEHVL